MPRSFKRETEFERRGREMAARVQAAEEPTGAWVVEGWLARGAVRTLSGPPKSGKTIRAASFAAAVSRGEAFEGWATRRTNVLYLAANVSPAEWTLAVRPLLPATDRWFRAAFGAFALDRDAAILALRARVEFGGVGLIVVDPLRDAVARSVGRATRGLETLCREKDVAGLVVG